MMLLTSGKQMAVAPVGGEIGKENLVLGTPDTMIQAKCPFLPALLGGFAR